MRLHSLTAVGILEGAHLRAGYENRGALSHAAGASSPGCAGPFADGGPVPDSIPLDHDKTKSVGFWYNGRVKKFPRATPIQCDVWYRIGVMRDFPVFLMLAPVQLFATFLEASPHPIEREYSIQK